MKRNKILSFLVGLLVVLGLFACDNTKTPEKTPDETKTEVTEVVTPEQTAPVTPTVSETPVVPTEPETVVPTEPSQTTPTPEVVDYASSVKLDWATESLKAEVTVKLHVDGDTTHFYIESNTFSGSVLKARYLAINTPESTGKIEAWGKTASNFTKSKLESATSIIIESDNATWNADSTGDRYLVWVWYKTDEMEDYRNLNIEILQEGLAIASNSEQNRYGKICGAAIRQAQRLELCCHSTAQDPNFYYGEAQELTLKELRLNAASYEGEKVAFEGVIYRDNSQTVYVEEYDEETGLYYGMTVYYGFGVTGNMLQILAVGNRVRIVGTVSAHLGNYQVSGLSYYAMRPKHPDNIQKLGEGFTGAYTKVTAEDFANKQVTIVDEEGQETSHSFQKLAMNTSISLDNLQVVSIYTTDNEESSSNGAMTLTCKSGNTTVTLRTIVLRDAQGEIITFRAYEGKTINVKGMVDCYDGEYQIKIFSANDITILN